MADQRHPETTAGYEAWLRTQTAVVEKTMADESTTSCARTLRPVPRNYYHWAQVAPSRLPALFDAPRVTAVGDLHIEELRNHGATRGRLAWGVNDFDEASDVAYTNDLVRLAASAALAYDARGSGRRRPSFAGPSSTLRDEPAPGGIPVVFAEGTGGWANTC